jgi:hypothetical protein
LRKISVNQIQRHKILETSPTPEVRKVMPAIKKPESGPYFAVVLPPEKLPRFPLILGLAEGTG